MDKLVSMWQELQKRGYQITNKRLLELPEQIKLNPENKRKKLIQELALVVDWIFHQKIVISTDFTDTESNYGFQYSISLIGNYNYHDEDMRHQCKEIWNFQNYYNSPTEAYSAAIEYVLKNLI